MSSSELEAEAAKWNIKGYAFTSGNIDRQIIIDALLKKDSANNSRVAVGISIVALVISVIAVIL